MTPPTQSECVLMTADDQTFSFSAYISAMFPFQAAVFNHLKALFAAHFMCAVACVRICECVCVCACMH